MSKLSYPHSDGPGGNGTLDINDATFQVGFTAQTLVVGSPYSTGQVGDIQTDTVVAPEKAEHETKRKAKAKAS